MQGLQFAGTNSAFRFFLQTLQTNYKVQTSYKPAANFVAFERFVGLRCGGLHSILYGTYVFSGFSRFASLVYKVCKVNVQVKFARFVRFAVCSEKICIFFLGGSTILPWPKHLQIPSIYILYILKSYFPKICFFYIFPRKKREKSVQRFFIKHRIFTQVPNNHPPQLAKRILRYCK